MPRDEFSSPIICQVKALIKILIKIPLNVFEGTRASISGRLQPRLSQGDEVEGSNESFSLMYSIT